MLQLITHLPLLSISVPGNATLYLRHMMDVATFEILPVEATWAIFNLPPQEPYSDALSRAGYTHQYLFENSRTATLLIHLFIPLVVIFALISLVTDKRVTTITKHPRVIKCRDSLLFGSSLRLWCELYLRIAVSASIGLLTMRWGGIQGTSIPYNNVFTITATIALLIFPLSALYFYNKKAVKLDDPSFKYHFGTLFDGLKI